MKSAEATSSTERLNRSRQSTTHEHLRLRRDTNTQAHRRIPARASSPFGIVISHLAVRTALSQLSTSVYIADPPRHPYGMIADATTPNFPSSLR